MEVEGNDRTNYPLLLPEKTVQVRCLPLIITTGDGKEFPTREVYVDMTQGTYWGRLMSIYSAQTMLPTGSEVLTFVEKEVASGEVKPRVLSGYGCALGERDPLESAGSAQ